MNIMTIDFGVNYANTKKYNDDDIDQILFDAKKAGVTHIVSISNSINECRRNVEIADWYIQNPNDTQAEFYFTAGVHPHDAKNFGNSATTVAYLRQILSHPRCIAVGECGLDFNRNFSTKQQQLSAFTAQVQLAKEMNKNLYIHCRDAFDDVVRILRDSSSGGGGRVSGLVHSSGVSGLVHCFTGTPDEAATFIDMGFNIGITGWLLDNRRNQSLISTIKSVSVDHLVVETDAPWMPIYPNKVSSPKDTIRIINEIERLKGGESCFEIMKNNALKMIGKD